MLGGLNHSEIKTILKTEWPLKHLVQISQVIIEKLNTKLRYTELSETKSSP